MLDRKLLLVTGKGGVGKSAFAAALALLATRQGLRVLIISMRDDQGLAHHLGVSRLVFQPREIRPGLHALQIDLGLTLNEYLRRQLHMPRVTFFGPLSKAFEVVATTMPGVREIITIGKPLFEAAESAWDLVIADAPPTGQIASYLGAPRTISSLVPAGRVRDEARWMSDQLADRQHTGLVVLSLPEELPVRETSQALQQIKAESLTDITCIVANRVLGALEVPAETVTSLGEGPHREAALLHTTLQAGQQTWLTELEPDRTLPYLFGMLTPTEVAARLADIWEAG